LNTARNETSDAVGPKNSSTCCTAHPQRNTAQ
jgi:hypothetical protein